MNISAKEVGTYYSLLRQIVRDLRNVAKEQFAPHNKYTELHDVIEKIHKDYISFFGRFLDDIRSAGNPEQLNRAKNRFCNARRRQARFRILGKADADWMLSRTSNVSEIRFLTAIIWYLSYSSDFELIRSKSLEMLDFEIIVALNEDKIGICSWRSASNQFWLKIDELSNSSELEAVTTKMLQYLIENYRLVALTYEELPRGPFMSRKMTPTKYSDLLMKVMERRVLGCSAEMNYLG